MLTRQDIACMAGVLKRVRVPASDVAAAETVKSPVHAKSDAARLYSVMSAAVLEKICRHSGLSVVSRRTTPYIVDTGIGKVAISVMVSSVSGSPAVKNIVIPKSSVRGIPGTDEHLFVAAFIGKTDRSRYVEGGVDVCLAGWLQSDEVEKLAVPSRVFSILNIHTVPVANLHTMDTLRGHLSGDAVKEESNEEAVHRMRAEAHR